MKKNLPYITIIVLFIGALSFHYLRHGIPSVFFSDLGGIYPELMNGDKNLLVSYIHGWVELLSSPSYLFDSRLNFVTPLALFFVEDIWLRIKIVQVLQMFFAAVFSYFFSRHIFQNKKVALLSGLLYASTPLFFSMLNGHNALTWSYVLLPATFLLIEKMFLTRKIFFSIAAGIMIALVTFFASIQFIFYIGIPVVGYGAIRCVNFIFKNKGYTRRYILLTGLSFFCVFTFSSLFLLPTFLGHKPYTQFEGETTYRQNDFVTNFYTPDLKEILSLQNKEQIVSSEFGYDLAQLPKKFIYFYVSASLIAFFSVFLISKKKQVFHNKFNYWTFFIVSALSFILSFGKHTFLFMFFDDFLPYFWTIRTPGRFLIVYVFFVSILAPFVVYKTLSIILSKFQNKQIINVVKTTLVLSGVLLIFYVSFFFGRFLLTFETIDSIDEHYTDLSAIHKKLLMLNSTNDYRVIDLVIEKDGNPHHAKAYSAGQRTFNNSYDILWRFRDDPNFARIIGMMNIKYIITAPWPSWPSVLDAPFPPLENRLEQNQDFKLVYSSSQGIKIWENQYALPKAYAAIPIFVIGPPSSISLALDLVPDADRAALFFADQITDKKDIADIIDKSKLVIINSYYEKKPSYLMNFNYGSVYNSDFYLNPQNYSKVNETVNRLVRERKKPIVEIKNQEQPAVIDLLSADVLSTNAISKQNGLTVEIARNNANISSDGKFGHRLEPQGFDKPSEIVYEIVTERNGRVKININAISLFNENYVKISTSKDGQNYKNILELHGNDTYPDFYDGFLWLNHSDFSPMFLKVETFTHRETSREIYDSRIEKMELAFIAELEYNYVNITKEELPNIFKKDSDLGFVDHYPGRSIYKTVDSIKSGSIVETEIYTPEWLLKNKKTKFKSLPANIFTNGFLIDELKRDSVVTIKYGMSLARGLGAAITIVTIIMLAIFFKKRI